MEDESRAMLDRLGLHVDVRAPLKRLSIGERQLVELCRVLLEEPRLLILDEPNSALNRRETERLFTVLQGLRSRGITMLYVSHRLEEVFSITRPRHRDPQRPRRAGAADRRRSPFPRSSRR